jgi:hypothetical protein
MVLFVVCLVLNGLSPFLTTSRAEGVVVSTGEETNPSNTTSSANSTGTINNSSIIVTPTNGTDYYMDDLYNPTHPSSPHADDDTGFSTPGGSSSGSSNITGNPNYPSGGGNIQSPPSGSSGSNGGDAYEFVAFLLWYVRKSTRRYVPLHFLHCTINCIAVCLLIVFGFWFRFLPACPPQLQVRVPRPVLHHPDLLRVPAA